MRISDWSSDVCSSDLGQDRAASAILVFRLVIEGHIAAHDREVEHLAGFGHTFDAADELPHDLRPLRVAEIHAVRRRQGHRAHSCDIAPAFGNRLLAALVRVRSEEHTSELQSLMRNSYAVFCLKKKKIT